MSFHRAVADEEHGWQENRPDGGSLSKNVLPNCRVFFFIFKGIEDGTAFDQTASSLNLQRIRSQRKTIINVLKTKSFWTHFTGFC